MTTALGAATEVEAKFVSACDLVARSTGAFKGPAFSLMPTKASIARTGAVSGASAIDAKAAALGSLPVFSV
jgi:hypothetical protein